MPRTASILTIATLVYVSLIPSAVARSLVVPGLHTKAIQVSVNYSINLPLGGGEPADQIKAMREGRKMLYKMAVGECDVLVETIASSCALTRLNARSNLSTRQPAQAHVNISASAQFSIQLKPRQ